MKLQGEKAIRTRRGSGERLVLTYQADRAEQPRSSRLAHRSQLGTGASDGTVLDADINGSYNILRKSSSDLLQLGRGVAGTAVRPRRLAV